MSTSVLSRGEAALSLLTSCERPQDLSNARILTEEISNLIDCAPITFSERSELKQGILRLKKIHPELDISSLLNRFNFEYLPVAEESYQSNKDRLEMYFESISSSSKLSHTRIDEVQKIDRTISENKLDGHIEADSSEILSQILSLDRSLICLSPIPKGYFILSNIYRHVSTLNTSYRMVIVGLIEIDVIGRLRRSSTHGEFNILSVPEQLQKQAQICGARIRKGASSTATSIIYAGSDAKSWNIESEVGKILRDKNVYSLSQRNSLTNNAAVNDDCVTVAVKVSSNSKSTNICLDGIFNRKPAQILYSLQDMLGKLELISSGSCEDPNIVSETIHFDSRPIQSQTSTSGGHTPQYPRDYLQSSKNLTFDSTETISKDISLSENSAPLLQIGKIDSNVFALDFQALSPLQAFSVAMATFYET